MASGTAGETRAAVNTEDVRRAFYSALPANSWAWVSEVWLDNDGGFLIVNDDRGDLWSVPFDVADGVQFGAPVRKRVQYVDADVDPDAIVDDDEMPGDEPPVELTDGEAEELLDKLRRDGVELTAAEEAALDVTQAQRIGGAEKLRQYWLYGEGAAKIRWGTKGDWTRCYRNLRKYMGPRAKGYCSNLHKRAVGKWPAEKVTASSDDLVLLARYAPEHEPMLNEAGSARAAELGVFALASAVSSHSTATSTGSWDGPANEARLSNDAGADTYRRVYAWQDPDKDPDSKAAWKFPHHEVSSDGTVGAANVQACRSAITALNGGRGGASIPSADRSSTYSHLARHLRDADTEPPALTSAPADNTITDNTFTPEPPAPSQERSMTAEQLQTIGLPEDASEEQINARLAELAQAQPEPNQQPADQPVPNPAQVSNTEQPAEEPPTEGAPSATNPPDTSEPAPPEGAPQEAHQDPQGQGTQAAFEAPEGTRLVTDAQWASMQQMARLGQQAFERQQREDREALLARAVEETRITPAEVPTWRERYDEKPDWTRSVLASLAPGRVPVDEIGHGGEDDRTNREDPAFAALAEQMGIPAVPGVNAPAQEK